MVTYASERVRKQEALNQQILQFMPEDESQILIAKIYRALNNQEWNGDVFEAIGSAFNSLGIEFLEPGDM